MFTPPATAATLQSVKSNVNSVARNHQQRVYISGATGRVARRIIIVDMRSQPPSGKVILGLAAALMAMEICGHAQSTASGPEIQMTAEKYDFKPDTVTVKKGDRVKLVITAVDHDHGFKIDGFQINQKLPKGQPVKSN